jgi:hypothetical protein
LEGSIERCRNESDRQQRRKAKRSGGHELKLPDITVPQHLTHPHPFVRAVRDQIEKRAQEVKRRWAESNGKMPALKVFPTSTRRGLRILQTTVQAAENPAGRSMKERTGGSLRI